VCVVVVVVVVMMMMMMMISIIMTTTTSMLMSDARTAGAGQGRRCISSCVSCKAQGVCVCVYVCVLSVCFGTEKGFGFDGWGRDVRRGWRR